MTLSNTTLTTLAATPDRLDATFALVPAGFRSWKPASWDGIPGERFSPLGQVCHVRDIEIEGYQVRITRMLAEENPALVSLDGYELAEGRNYDAADPREALAAFRAARSATMRRLGELTADQLSRRGSFGEHGALTLRSLVHYLVKHDLQHLACLEWLLGRLHGTEGVG
jgi:hypothetical protein